MVLCFNFNGIYFVFLLNVLCGGLTIFTMENKDTVHIPFYFQPIKRWKIDEMKSFRMEGSTIFANNQGQTITAKELYLLDEALEADKKNKFKSFYMQLDQGKLRTFLNAIEKAEATRLRRLLIRSFFPLEIQRQFVQPMKNIIINGLQDEVIKQNVPQRPIYLNGHEKSVSAVTFSPDNKVMVSASRDKLIVWNCQKKELLKSWDSPSYTITAIATSPDNSMMITGGSGESLSIWTEREEEQESIILKSFNTSLLKFSHNGQMFVSGHRDEYVHCKLRLWNSAKRTLKRVLDTCADIFFVGFSPDDTKIVSVDSSNYKNINVWDIETGKSLWSIKGKICNNYRECHIPGRWLIARCDRDGEKNESRLFWYDLEAQKELGYGEVDNQISPYLFTCMSSPYLFNKIANEFVSHSPNGKMLASGSTGEKSNLILWQMLTDEEENALNQVKIIEDVENIGLLYDLCLMLSRNRIMRLHENCLYNRMFALLPDVVQKLLQPLFFKVDQKMLELSAALVRSQFMPKEDALDEIDEMFPEGIDESREIREELIKLVKSADYGCL